MPGDCVIIEIRHVKRMKKHIKENSLKIDSRNELYLGTSDNINLIIGNYGFKKVYLYQK